MGCLLGTGAANAAALQQTPLPAPGVHATPATPVVRPGIEVLLADSLHLVQGRTVGLITNHTGRDRAGTPTIDLLFRHPEVRLAALFSPEHGIRGVEDAGAPIASGRDQRTGLPIHSLYGKTRRPTPEMLRDLDVLVFDMQDIGARYYTYVSTMALAMEAAGDAGIPFVVLDRPNPIRGDVVQGNVLDPEFATFVGLFPVPMRHGMTAGELARMYAGAFGIEVELHVVPAEGWRREMIYTDTGLPWIPPSPNMPSLESALAYPGTCLFEGTPLSVGRGTDRAFQWVGAPWLDGAALADSLNALDLPGVRFEAVTFTPRDPGDGKFDGEAVHGVRFIALSSDYDAPRAAVALLRLAYARSGSHWTWRERHFDRLAGTAALREGIVRGDAPEELTAGWDDQIRAFRSARAPYLIY
ncbi:MAG: exo-beta-N-acetylmuramidase NamZ domain-containing protein [Gemmatimonadota bacterium]